MLKNAFAAGTHFGSLQCCPDPVARVMEGPGVESTPPCYGPVCLCLSLCPPLCLHVCLSVCLLVCLFVSVCQSHAVLCSVSTPIYNTQNYQKCWDLQNHGRDQCCHLANRNELIQSDTRPELIYLILYTTYNPIEHLCCKTE